MASLQETPRESAEAHDIRRSIHDFNVRVEAGSKTIRSLLLKELENRFGDITNPGYPRFNQHLLQVDPTYPELAHYGIVIVQYVPESLALIPSDGIVKIPTRVTNAVFHEEGKYYTGSFDARYEIAAQEYFTHSLDALEAINKLVPQT